MIMVSRVCACSLRREYFESLTDSIYKLGHLCLCFMVF